MPVCSYPWTRFSGRSIVTDNGLMDKSVKPSIRHDQVAHYDAAMQDTKPSLSKYHHYIHYSTFFIRLFRLIVWVTIGINEITKISLWQVLLEISIITSLTTLLRILRHPRFYKAIISCSQQCWLIKIAFVIPANIGFISAWEKQSQRLFVTLHRNCDGM